jgi:hypothetical protein
MYGENDPRCNLCDLEKNIGRGEQHAVKIAKIRRLARSIGCLVSEVDLEECKLKIKQSFFESPLATLRDNLQKEYPTAEIFDVNFANEPCLGRGTGFLIGEDLVLSAAHTVIDIRNPNKIKPGVPTHFIFGYECETPAAPQEANKGKQEKPPTHSYGYQFEKDNV